MSKPQPPVWRAFYRAERAVGKPLEDLVGSSGYLDVMLRGMKVQRAVSGAVLGAVGGVAAKVLHVVNMPTRGDVLRLSRQMTGLTQEMRALAAAQHEASAPARRPRAKPAAKKKDEGHAA